MFVDVLTAVLGVGVVNSRVGVFFRAERGPVAVRSYGGRGYCIGKKYNCIKELRLYTT